MAEVMRAPEPILTDDAGQPFELDPTTAYERQFHGKSYYVTVAGAKRPKELFFFFNLEENIQDAWFFPRMGQKFLDVGCSQGSWTLPALAHGAEVIAVDPDRECFWCLAMNLFINKFERRCRHLPLLLSDHESASADGLTATVDSLGLIALDWMKVDVEGHELRVLRGATQTLRRCRPTVIVENHCEFVPGIDERVAEFMRPLGYREEKWPGNGKGNDNHSKWSPA